MRRLFVALAGWTVATAQGAEDVRSRDLLEQAFAHATSADLLATGCELPLRLF